MPKIRAFTPSWLSAAFPDGHELFEPSSQSSASVRSSVYGNGSNGLGNSTSRKDTTATAGGTKSGFTEATGPRRTIARRGTEVFVARGKEIRWTDLATMKRAHEEGEGTTTTAKTTSTTSTTSTYRILTPPVADEIRQLVMSPQNNYMAIVTTHTVHICVLPDRSHLATPSKDAGTTLKTRYFTLGPTTHITTRSPVAAVAWHPLGVNDTAVVTVTRDAVVRLWEISPLDRWSFDAAALSIDAKKLADGTWLDQDFGASLQTNAGFSPDSVGMEVTAAHFGPRSAGGWSSMTLWLAMAEGDVYALAPLLPKRWAPPAALIPSLSVAIVSHVAALEDDPHAAAHEKRLARQQLEWMAQLDSQEPALVESVSSLEPPAEVYTRPSKPSAIPRLQGPFEIDYESESESNEDEDEDEDDELCDILVIGEKVDPAFLLGTEDDDLDYADLLDPADQEGLSLPVLCLIFKSGKMRICLVLVGVEAQWLPPRTHHRSASSSNNNYREGPSSHPLMTFQIIDVVRDSEKLPDGAGWCSFSPDVTSRYAFFITHPGGITHISLTPWVFRLEQELQESEETGADFRLKQLVTGENTLRQRVYTHSPHHREEVLSTSLVLRDPDLGYFLLSDTDHAAVAICFETPEGDGDDLGASLFRSTMRSSGFGRSLTTPPLDSDELEDAAAPIEEVDPTTLALDFWKARPAFVVPPALAIPSELTQAKQMLFSSRYQMLQHQPVRLSPAVLDIFANVHKLVGRASGRLVQALGEVFTQLEDLPVELQAQVVAAAQLKRRVDAFSDDDSSEGQTDDVRLRRRLDRAQDRQAALATRMDRLRRLYSRASARPLSDKERAWSQEVRSLETSLSEKSGLSSNSPSKQIDIGRRALQVQTLWETMSAEAKSLEKTQQQQQQQVQVYDAKEGVDVHKTTTSAGLHVPTDVRKAKMAQVNKLLERETAMVEAVTERLERLGVA